MILYLVLLCLPIPQHITGNNKPIIMSLGDACGPALVMRALGLREQAYPFDWIVSPYSALKNALLDDFAHFFEPESLKLRPDNTGVIDYYGFNFTHDLPTTHQSASGSEDFIHNAQLSPHWPTIVQNVWLKYQRRINRFREALASGQKVILVRSSRYTTKEQAIEIRNIIATCYPQLDFMLLIVNAEALPGENWELDHIKHIYYNPQVAYDDPATWKAIYESIGVPVGRASSLLALEHAGHTSCKICFHTFEGTGHRYSQA